MNYQVFWSWLCACINQWIRFRPLITCKSECHALSRCEEVMVLPAVFTSVVLTVSYSERPIGGCGVEMGSVPWYCVMVTKWQDSCWLCGCVVISRDSLNFPVDMTRVVKEQTMTDLLNSSCVSLIFAVNSWTRFLLYLITINKWAVRVIMTNCPLQKGLRQDYGTWCGVCLILGGKKK